MIDLYVFDLDANVAKLDRRMDDLQTAEWLVCNEYCESWPHFDPIVHVAVERGEIVWMHGKRRGELRSFGWMLRRLSVRLFQPKPWPVWV